MSEETGKVLDSADIQRLLEVLPHRYPLLLVDRIVEIDGDDSAVGIKNVTMNEPHFTGHFPGKPIMPGVLIVESMAQTAGAIALLSRKSDVPALVYFMSIDGAKFRKPVVPGDQMRIHVQKIKRRGGLMKYACQAMVDGVKVAEAEVTAMLIDQNDALGAGDSASS